MDKRKLPYKSKTNAQNNYCTVYFCFLLPFCADRPALYMILIDKCHRKNKNDVTILANFGTAYADDTNFQLLRALAAGRRWIRVEFDKISKTDCNNLSWSVLPKDL